MCVPAPAGDRVVTQKEQHVDLPLSAMVSRQSFGLQAALSQLELDVKSCAAMVL